MRWKRWVSTHQHPLCCTGRVEDALSMRSASFLFRLARLLGVLPSSAVGNVAHKGGKVANLTVNSSPYSDPPPQSHIIISNIV